MSFPELGIRNLNHPTPKIGLRQMVFPRPEILCIESGEFRGHPRLSMDAVGDTGDRHFMDRNSCPNILPERLTNLAVKPADSIGMPTHAQSQNRHAKARDGIGRCLAKTKKFVERNL